MWLSRVSGRCKGTYVSRVVASKVGEGAAFVTFDGHRNDDYGSTFSRPMTMVRAGKRFVTESGFGGKRARCSGASADQNLLFAGLEFGLWVSWDRGANWTALKNNFPTVPVDDIQIQARENDLVLATHGRSIWIFDDITALEKMDSSVVNSDLTFFPPHAATTFNIRMRRWSGGQKVFTAKNPAYGAILNYYLKDAVPPEPPKTESKAEKGAAAKGDQEEKERRAKPLRRRKANPLRSLRKRER